MRHKDICQNSNHMGKKKCFILWESCRISCEILDFCSGVVEINILLGCGTLSLGEWWLIFWNNIMVSTSRLKKSRTSQPQLLMFWRRSRYAFETWWKPISNRGSIMSQKFYVFNHTDRKGSRFPIYVLVLKRLTAAAFIFIIMVVVVMVTVAAVMMVVVVGLGWQRRWWWWCLWLWFCWYWWCKYAFTWDMIFMFVWAYFQTSR